MWDSVDEYCSACSSEEPAQLGFIERESNLRMAHGRMCSGHLQGRLLKMLTGMIRPLRALELGTFTGYSALCIAEGMAEYALVKEGAKLITVEANDEAEGFIRQQLADSPFGHLVELRMGEALTEMRRMPSESIDMIFIDADKRSYCDYYREGKRLLRPGGYMIADNTLWDGKLVAGGRLDAQARGVLEFNRLVAEDPDTEQVMLPLRDGLTLIRLQGSKRKAE